MMKQHILVVIFLWASVQALIGHSSSDTTKTTTAATHGIHTSDVNSTSSPVFTGSYKTMTETVKLNVSDSPDATYTTITYSVLETPANATEIAKPTTKLETPINATEVAKPTNKHSTKTHSTKTHSKKNHSTNNHSTTHSEVTKGPLAVRGTSTTTGPPSASYETITQVVHLNISGSPDLHSSKTVTMTLLKPPTDSSATASKHSQTSDPVPLWTPTFKTSWTPAPPTSKHPVHKLAARATDKAHTWSTVTSTWSDVSSSSVSSSSVSSSSVSSSSSSSTSPISPHFFKPPCFTSSETAAHDSPTHTYSSGSSSTLKETDTSTYTHTPYTTYTTTETVVRNFPFKMTHLPHHHFHPRAAAADNSTTTTTTTAEDDTATSTTSTTTTSTSTSSTPASDADDDDVTTTTTTTSTSSTSSTPTSSAASVTSTADAESSTPSTTVVSYTTNGTTISSTITDSATTTTTSPTSLDTATLVDPATTTTTSSQTVGGDGPTPNPTSANKPDDAQGLAASTFAGNLALALIWILPLTLAAILM